MMVSSEPGIIHQTSPPGGGKTACVAQAIPKILEQDPNALIVLTTPSNSATAELVDETMPLLGLKQKALVLLSTFAKDEYGYRFEKHSQHLLMHAIKVFREEVDSGERGCDKSSARNQNRYANNILEGPYLADDIAAFKTLLGEKVALPRVIFLSISLLERCEKSWKSVLISSSTNLVLLPHMNRYMLLPACLCFERLFLPEIHNN